MRTLVFKKNVHVQQGDLSIRCDLLEAFYPKDGNQPDRLVARGKVRMAQASADQAASCDLAIYDRVRDRFTCKGNASFRDGEQHAARHRDRRRPEARDRRGQGRRGALHPPGLPRGKGS